MNRYSDTLTTTTATSNEKEWKTNFFYAGGRLPRRIRSTLVSPFEMLVAGLFDIWF